MKTEEDVMIKAPAKIASILLCCGVGAGGCAQSAYDFPVATMIGEQRGYSMTGYVGTADEAVAREEVIKRLQGVCPKGADIVDFKSDRADAAIGTKILRYEALATCRT